MCLDVYWIFVNPTIVREPVLDQLERRALPPADLAWRRLRIASHAGHHPSAVVADLQIKVSICLEDFNMFNTLLIIFIH